jgi:hypothetical protein
LAESCNGVSNDCPADAKSTAVCRASAGTCDLAGTCDGINNSCPPDAKAATCPLTYSCYCVGSSCGNGAISGNHLDVQTGITPEDVVTLYGPNRVAERATGWSCLVETAENVCTCVGMPNNYLCGNNGVGGNGGDTFTNINTSETISLFGVRRIGTEDTGWACYPSRVGDGNPLTYTCTCVDAACGNGALAGVQGNVQTGVSASDVVNLYGPDRIAPRATGWACLPTASNIVECVGLTSGLYVCGNAAFGGNGGDTVDNVSTADAVQNYGVARVGTQSTGWAATAVSY